jgi:hypothetical protein
VNKNTLRKLIKEEIEKTFSINEGFINIEKDIADELEISLEELHNLLDDSYADWEEIEKLYMSDSYTDGEKISLIKDLLKFEDNKENLKEGWKEVVLGAAMLLGTNLSLAQNNKAEQVIRNQEILNKVKETLEDADGISNLSQELGIGVDELKSYMDKNAKNIEDNFNKFAKKKDLNIHLTIPKDSLKGYKGKIMNGGYAIKGIETVYDTIIQNPHTPITMSDTLKLDLPSNNFETGGEDLDDSVRNSISEYLKLIKESGGSITDVKIISKTDAERASRYISDEDPTGNKTLAYKRAKNALKAIKNSGLSFGDAKISMDYTSNVDGGESSKVSREEFRKYSNDKNKLSSLRELTSDERGVEIVIEWKVDFEPQDEAEIIVDKIVKVILVKSNLKPSEGITRKTKKTPTNTPIKIKIDKNTFECDNLGCKPF